MKKFYNILLISIIGLVIAIAVMAFNNPPPGGPPIGNGAIGSDSGAPASSLFIKSNGTVGIGTTNPNLIYKLDVQGGSVNASGGLCMNTICKTDWNQVQGTSYWAQSGNNLYASSTSWNVGIGTTGPAEELHVVGTAQVGKIRGTTADGTSDLEGLKIIRRDNSGTHGIFFNSNVGDTAGQYWENMLIYNDGGGSNIGFWTGPTAAERMRITAGGNVGIGTTAPVEKLSVQGTGSQFGVGYVGTGANRLIIGAETNPNGAEANVGFIGYGPTAGGGASRSIAFGAYTGSAWTEIMRLQSGGNVGIGTTPSYLLHLEKIDTTNPLLYVRNTGTSGNSPTAIFRGGANNAVNHFQVQDYDGNADFVVQGTGNVGIGTTAPTSRLSLGGGASNESQRIAVYEAGGGANFYGIGMAHPDTNYGVGIWVNKTVTATNMDFYVQNGGNVGIGTTNPGARLDVGGGNIVGVNKLTANSIDPVFKINGQQYVTYVPDSIGQKVEVVGQGQLVNGEWSIDLSQQKENSDLWLFYQIVKLETIVPFVSSQSSASLYAYIDGSNLMVKLKDGDLQAKFSYQLTASRIDQKTDYLTPETTSSVYIDVDCLKNPNNCPKDVDL